MSEVDVLPVLPSISHRDLIDDKFRDLRRPRRLVFFKNGDPFFAGRRIKITPHRYLSFSHLLADLTRSIELPHGVRRIFTTINGTEIKDIEDLEDGESYVCGSFENFKPMKYGEDRQLLKMPYKVGMFKGKPHNHDLAFSVDVYEPAYRGGFYGAYPPGRVVRNSYPTLALKQPGTFGSGRASVGKLEAIPVQKPKVITVIKAGDPPRKKVSILLNKRAVQSVGQLMLDISEALGCPKWKNDRVRRLFTLNGREVRDTDDLFRGDNTFIGTGPDHPSPSELQDIFQDLYPDSPYAQNLLKEWEDHQRKPRRRRSRRGDRDSGMDSDSGASMDARGEKALHPVGYNSRDKGIAALMDYQRGLFASDEREKAKRFRERQADAERRAIEEERKRRALMPVQTRREGSGFERHHPAAAVYKPMFRRQVPVLRPFHLKPLSFRPSNEKPTIITVIKHGGEDPHKHDHGQVVFETVPGEARKKRRDRKNRDHEHRDRDTADPDDARRKREEEEKRRGLQYDEEDGKYDPNADKKKLEEEKRRKKKQEDEEEARRKKEERRKEEEAARRQREQEEETAKEAARAAREAREAARRQREKEKEEEAARKAQEKAQEKTQDKIPEEIPEKTQDKPPEDDADKENKEPKEPMEPKPPKEPKKLTKIQKKDGKRQQLPNSDEIERKYEIGRQLGDGNFAVVRMATLKNIGTEYAVKIIDKSKLKGKEFMIDNEIAVMHKCQHPNIVRLIEEYETPTEVYLIMELVKGGDLFDAITQSVKFDERDSALMVRDLAEALLYLHSRNIVHRDLKPENLLVCRHKDGLISLKLTDFGLAMNVTELIYTVCGTPTYVAPEILAETGYGLEVDMWALGVITYILLSGFPPFRSLDRNQEELFKYIQAGEFEYLSPYWDPVSDSAKDLINHMLVVDRSKRYKAIDVLCHPWIITEGGFKEYPPNLEQYIANLRKDLEHQTEEAKRIPTD